MRAATVLRRSGWTKSMFGKGTPVKIMGSPDRHEPNTCYLGTITFADGTSMDRYGQRQRAAPLVTQERPDRLPNGDPNINGDWAAEQLVMTDPTGRGGALVPLSTVEQYRPGEGTVGDPTRAGQGGARQYATREAVLTDLGRREAAEFQTYTVEDNPRMRCETTSILFDWTFDGPVNRITQDRDTIVMQYGQLGLRRTIHMNVKEHPKTIKPSRAGHSIGRWEGDTLVIDTVAITAIPFGSVPHSDRVHVVERIRAVDDGAALVNEVTITDPVMYTRPVTVRQYYKAAPPDARMLEYECTEGMWIEHEERRGIRADQ